MDIFWIGLGGGVGALARYIIGKAFNSSSIPWGTFIVNVLGSFLLGLMVGVNIDNRSYAFLGIGILGGFTTFSTFHVELLTIWKDQKKSAIFYLFLTYITGICSAIVGLWITAS
ncbi:CrcB family protein [Bacillus spongiae]|uniref:Fluoride-specific ion channel FluC n=1 Tax=Bacillus spongiae TaxID=2683610 RepID=A0ABU8HIK0_9BACI